VTRDVLATAVLGWVDELAKAYWRGHAVIEQVSHPPTGGSGLDHARVVAASKAAVSALNDAEQAYAQLGRELPHVEKIFGSQARTEVSIVRDLFDTLYENLCDLQFLGMTAEIKAKELTDRPDSLVLSAYLKRLAVRINERLPLIAKDPSYGAQSVIRMNDAVGNLRRSIVGASMSSQDGRSHS